MSLVQNLEQNSITQIAIVTFKFTRKSIQELSFEMARSYKLGQKEDNNGVLLVVAPNEKKVRIEVGYGLEGVLTDAISSQIINSVIIAEFNGKMSEGVKEGVFAFIFAVFFLILKDVFKRNSHGDSLPMGFRRGGSGSNGGGGCSSGRGVGFGGGGASGGW